jgi:hypothetical protein
VTQQLTVEVGELKQRLEQIVASSASPATMSAAEVAKLEGENTQLTEVQPSDRLSRKTTR